MSNDEYAVENVVKETVFLIHAAELVITTIDEDVVRHRQLQRVHHQEHLAVVVTAINEVTVEEVEVLLAWPATKTKGRHKVGELAVSVTNDHNAST